MRLVDTHCHIHDEQFDRDPAGRDAAVGRARSAGVALMLTLGTNVADSRTAVAFARRHAGTVVAATGVHPHDAKDATDDDLAALAELARDPIVALVGEIGLDFYRNLSPIDQQVRVLRTQLLTAMRIGKPVAVHGRDAHDALTPILGEYSAELGGKLTDGRPIGVMHYFSEDASMARRYIEMGFLISVHTSVTHPRADLLADVVRQVDIEQLVLETDSPYGAPQRHRGRRNEPAYVTDAAERVAELKGLDVSEVAQVTTANAERLLGVPVRDAVEAGAPPA